MKPGRIRRSPSVREASKRLSVILGRARRLGVDLRPLTSVSLLRQACGVTEGGRVLTAVVFLSLLLSLYLSLLLVPSSTVCKSNNSSKEIHIETISWHRQHVEAEVVRQEGGSPGRTMRNHHIGIGWNLNDNSYRQEIWFGSGASLCNASYINIVTLQGRYYCY